jgi:hypothetical protein
MGAAHAAIASAAGFASPSPGCAGYELWPLTKRTS